MILGHKYFMAITVTVNPLSWSWDTHITRQLQSTHVTILGHTYCTAITVTHYKAITVHPCHDLGTHVTRQLQWHTYYKAITVTHTLQGNYSDTHITRQLQWHTHYKAITVTHILQGNYSDTHITRQLQSAHVMILGHTLQGNYSDTYITRQLQSTHVMIRGRMHSKAITVTVASHSSTGWTVTRSQSVLLHWVPAGP